jgi:hypothetical protein
VFGLSYDKKDKIPIRNYEFSYERAEFIETLFFDHKISTDLGDF